jgi:hypothetical protein
MSLTIFIKIYKFSKVTIRKYYIFNYLSRSLLGIQFILLGWMKRNKAVRSGYVSSLNTKIH